MHNGTFMGTPALFTGGAGVVKGCGAVVIVGFLTGRVAAALL